MTPFDGKDGKCQNVQTSFITFLIFAKVRPVRTKLTGTLADTHTHTHTHTDTDKPIAIVEILKICLTKTKLQLLTIINDFN